MSFLLALGIVAAGVGVGVFSALFGVGGGVIMVPFIVLVLDETQHLAEGTSLLVIVPTAVVGVLAHRRSGYISLPHGVLLAVGGIAGSVVGAILALRISGESLQTVFAVFVALMGIRLIYRGLRKMRSGENAVD
ncbi:MAG: sulfite exporter TauE/SafE family protein [Actinomycetota bacterium]